MNKDTTLAIVTINEMGKFDKRGAARVAKWLRDTAEEVETNYKLWDEKKGVFKYIVPAKK